MSIDDDSKTKDRCPQCTHLKSFHGEDGCGTWLLGIRSIPLYKCSCVVSQSSTPKRFPTTPQSIVPISYNPPPPPLEPLRLTSAKLNPVPYHIGEASIKNNPIQYDNKTNPEDVLSSLANTLATRNILSDNDYTESQRQHVIVLALSLQKALKELEK